MLIIGILLFAVLVVVHEYGHFIAARRNGVEVEEFGIGFPPRLIGKRIRGTLYSFNLLPLGGFVKLKGETDSDRRGGSFGASSLWVKTKILMAGVGMNVVAAAVIVMFLSLYSLPTIIDNQYQVPANQTVTGEAVIAAQVVEGSPADEAGIISGHEIVAINGESIVSSQQLRELTERLSGQEVVVEYIQHRELESVTLTLGEDEDQGYLGVAPLDLETSRYTWAAPLVGVGLTLQMIWLVLTTLADIVVGLAQGAGQEAAAGVAGPVGIVFLLTNLADFGFEYLLFLIASISVSLAVFNALPIPALDGGRLAVILGARLVNKPLNERVEGAIHATGFVLLIGLIILITYVDIQRFF